MLLHNVTRVWSWLKSMSVAIEMLFYAIADEDKNASEPTITCQGRGVVVKPDRAGRTLTQRTANVGVDDEIEARPRRPTPMHRGARMGPYFLSHDPVPSYD